MALTVVDGFARAIVIVALVVDANHLALTVVDGFAWVIAVIALVIDANHLALTVVDSFARAVARGVARNFYMGGPIRSINIKKHNSIEYEISILIYLKH